MSAAPSTRQALLFREPDYPELPAGLSGLPVTEGRCLLPFQLFKGRACSQDALIVAAYLDGLVGERGYACWQTDAVIARETGICRRSVQFGLQELREKGAIHVARQHFQRRNRRIIFLLWKVPETFPRLDAEGPRPRARDSARSCAKKSAPSCAVESAPSCASKPDSANPCAPIAHDHALSYPISNSVLSSKEETLRALTPGEGEEDGPANPESTAPVRVADPTPEQVAEWEELARGDRPCDPKDRWMARAKLGDWREVLAARAAPAPIPTPTPTAPLAFTPPLPPPPPARIPTEDLIRRLASPSFGPEAVDEAAARLAEVLDDEGSFYGFRAKLDQVRAGDIPLERALQSYRAATAGGADRPGAIFMSRLKPRGGPAQRSARALP